MAINIACLGGHLNVVKYLVTELKCDPKSPGFKARTPLHLACDNGQYGYNQVSYHWTRL